MQKISRRGWQSILALCVLGMGGWLWYLFQVDSRARAQAVEARTNIFAGAHHLRRLEAGTHTTHTPAQGDLFLLFGSYRGGSTTPTPVVRFAWQSEALGGYVFTEVPITHLRLDPCTGCAPTVRLGWSAWGCSIAAIRVNPSCAITHARIRVPEEAWPEYLAVLNLPPPGSVP